MKRKIVIAATLAALALASACAASDERSGSAVKQAKRTERTAPPSNETASQAHQHADGHEHGAPSDEIPAFLTTAADLKSLKPTLAPEMFAGKQRLGYQAAKEIPKTLAQLPCYCHCDKGFGHKSLQSCFVDDHAAHCAICIDEALVAYDLEKKEGLKPEQIRERVVAQFSN